MSEYDFPELGYSTNPLQDFPEDYYDDGENDFYLGDDDDDWEYGPVNIIE